MTTLRREPNPKQRLERAPQRTPCAEVQKGEKELPARRQAREGLEKVFMYIKVWSWEIV